MCDFDKMFLFDLVACSLSEGRELHDNVLIHIFTTNIHYRVACNLITLEERKKKRKEKSKTNI